MRHEFIIFAGLLSWTWAMYGNASPAESPDNSTAPETSDTISASPAEEAPAERIWILKKGDTPDVEKRGNAYVSGAHRTESPLPTGYPRPTPPGAIEVKTYPVVRRAEADNSRGGGFGPLFRHISSRDIAMTAPVEMDYDAEGGATMSFLYRVPELGPTGEMENGVTVVDAPPVTVISLGMSGRTGRTDWNAAFETLREAAANLEGWKTTDQVRTMGYNGPSVPRSRQWWEAQIILERIEADEVSPAESLKDAYKLLNLDE